MDKGILFTNGSVFVDGGFAPRGTSVLIREDRIAAVGPAVESEGAEVVDLDGGTLLPGFIDAHAHPVFGGVQLRGCDLSAATDAGWYLKIIDRYARENPDREWITGGGWGMPAFPGGIPTRQALDSVVADRPVFLQNRDGHGAWVNSKALELAGIDKRTADPSDGRIERDERGDPVGMLQEGAMQLVARLLPPVTDEDRYLGLLAGQDYLLSLGVTGWQDAIVGRGFGEDDATDAYRRAASAGTLLANVVGALWWQRHQGLEQLEELLHRRGSDGAGRFRPTSVKMMLDGVAENHTAAMLEPVPRRPRLRHRELRPRFHRSRRTAPVRHRARPPRLPGALPRARRPGGAQRAQRDRSRQARQQGLDDPPPPGAPAGHSPGRHPAVRRARRDREHPAAVGHPRVADDRADDPVPRRDAEARRQYPFAALAKSGAHLAGGSDWPVSSPDPLLGVHVAVNRSLPENAADPFLPEQAISLRTALAAYTAGSARINGLGNTVGLIKAGYDADLAIVDADLAAIPDSEICQASVRQTWVRGELAYDSKENR